MKECFHITTSTGTPPYSVCSVLPSTSNISTDIAWGQIARSNLSDGHG